MGGRKERKRDGGREREREREGDYEAYHFNAIKERCFLGVVHYCGAGSLWN